MKKNIVLFFTYLLVFVGLYFFRSSADDRNNVLQELNDVSVMVESRAGLGSGTVINKENDTYILTAYHVIESCLYATDGSPILEPVKINLIHDEDGKVVGQTTYYAKIAVFSKQEDMAILKLDKKHAFPLSAKIYNGLSYKIPGTRIISVGSPYGGHGYNSFGSSVIAGNARMAFGHSLIQTNSLMFHGNSGGGIFLENGEYLGMAICINARNEAIGYFHPVQNIKKWARSVGYGFIFGLEP